MNTAENLVQWRQSHATWFCVAGLLMCLGALYRVPAWWKGQWNSGYSLGRQRTYLVQWLGITFVAIGALVASLVPNGERMSTGDGWLILIPMAIGAVLLVLILPVWHLSAFEFFVPPGLRRNVPGGPPDFGRGRPLTAAFAAAQNASRRAPVRKPAATGPDGSGTLRFERPRVGWRDRRGIYRVELDGGEVGTLRYGNEFSVPVAAGTHTVRGAVSFTGSPKVKVRVRAGQTTVVRIRPLAGNPLVQVAAPDTYLAIEVAED